MRIFIGLDIDENIRERIARFMEGLRGFAPDARWVKPESLHLTLKFVGEKSGEEIERIKSALSGIRANAIEITFRGHGFFPTPNSARVFWVGIEAGPQLGALAAEVENALLPLRIAKEGRDFSPHLTLARGGSSRAPQWQERERANSKLRKLQEKLAARPAPDFGTMTAHEFFLYESKLSPAGSKYTKVERFPLR